MSDAIVCPTCHGRRVVTWENPCTDCIDGTMPAARAWAIVREVFGEWMDAYACDTPHDVLPYLRNVKS